MSDQSNHCPPLGGQRTLRRLCWLLAGAALVLAALLLLPLPTVVNRAAVRPPAVTQYPTARPLTPVPPRPSLSVTTGTLPKADAELPDLPVQPSPTRDQAHAASVMNAPMPTPFGHAFGRVAESIQRTFFLPLVARAASQEIPLSIHRPASPQNRIPEQPRPTAVRAAQLVTATAVGDTSSAPISGFAGQQLFLALVFRSAAATDVRLRIDEGSPALASQSVEAGSGAPAQGNGVLFLPLVAANLVEPQAQAINQPTPNAQPGARSSEASIPTPTALPSSTPTPMQTPAISQSTPTGQSDAESAQPFPLTPTVLPGSAAGQTSTARQQLQTLLDQLDGLIGGGVLTRDQGQPLRDLIAEVMQLPIVIQGHAPPNPTGQPRPWQRKMQNIIEQIEQMTESGALRADQAQPLLDQAQTIIQTLGSR